MWDMVLIVTGGLFSTVLAVIGAWTLRVSTILRVVAVVVALASGGTTLALAFLSQRDAAVAKEETASIKSQLNSANQELVVHQALLQLINFTVGDLAKLNAISGGTRYYVRVAADTDRSRLEPYLEYIYRQFKGARESGMVAIREPEGGSKLYRLVFGQHLDVSAAEVFHRLATSHRLPPEGQHAAIVPEP